VGLIWVERVFWIDELLSLNHAKEITGWGSFVSPSSGDLHPPFYFLLLKGWLFFGEGESWARLLSVLFGIAVIPVTFLLARQFFSQRASLLASLLVGVSPLLLLYDREVRNYPLFSLLSMISLYFFIRCLREAQMWCWAGYAAFTLLAIYTHYHGFLLILSEVIFVALRFNTFRPRLKAFVLSLAIVGLLFLPMLPTLFGHLQVAQELHSEGGRFPVLLGYPAKPLYIGFAFALGQTLLPWNPLAIVGGLVVLTILAFSLGELRQQRETTTFFFACLLVPIVLGPLVSEAMPRYYLFVVPLFYMLLATGMMGIPKLALRYFLGVFLAIVWGLGISNYYSNREFHILAHVTPWREVGQFLKANVVQDDTIFHVALKPKIEIEPLSYYAQMHIPVYDQEAIAALPELTTGGSVPRVWLVVSESTLQEVGRSAVSWLADNYSECQAWRYFHDPHFQLKKRFFRKDFSEYRIQVFRFEKPQVDGAGKVVCCTELRERP